MDRELDAEVARLVMGYSGERVTELVGREVKVWRKFPKYTTDPAADYSVLEHVRATWAPRQQCGFANALWKLYMERYAADEIDEPLNGVELQCRYHAVGDYSRAALAVVKANQEGDR